VKASPPLPTPNRRQAWRRHEDKQLLQRERELDAARRICEALSQHVHVDEMVQRAIQTVLDVLEADGGSVLLAEPESKQLVFRHSIGKKPVPQGTGMPWNLGIAGAVFQSGKPEVIEDAKLDHRHYQKIDELTGYKSHDMIVVPLKRWEGSPIGVLEVLNKRGSPLQEDALPVLLIISAFTTLAIEQARLFQQAKLAESVSLLGGICHDVKNMLMPVSCGLNLLKQEVKEVVTDLSEVDPKKARRTEKSCDEIFGILEDDTGRISDRVKEIADCVKGLSLPPVFASCRIADVVDKVVQSIRLLADGRQVLLRTDGLNGLPPILADERRLYNAFYNLINNAIPEVPAGGSVTVSGQMDTKGREVLVTIADTGRGMPPEVRDSLFTARAISRKPGGTGLGTKIVKDVVDAHGGRITVESREGVGTSFRIWLPLCPPGAPAR
jgi:signal transduction histidine kinase